MLFIAEVNPKLIDEQVNVQMSNFMSIVETARKLREQKKVSLKQPISSLTLVNSNPAIFEGLAPFFFYIQEEVNVEDIKNEKNVEKYVRLEALPNLPVLGPRFKGNKSFGDVKAAIAKLTTIDLEKVRETGEVVLAGNTLSVVHYLLMQNDLVIQEKFVADNIGAEEAIGGDRLMYSLYYLAFCWT